ncbi:hypothetical protein ACJJIL_07320 [Microbulbifer sp. EKSA005]
MGELSKSKAILSNVRSISEVISYVRLSENKGADSVVQATIEGLYLDGK